MQSCAVALSCRTVRPSITSSTFSAKGTTIMPELTPEQGAAVTAARRQMHAQLEAAFPRYGTSLYLLACCGGLVDALNHPTLAPTFATQIDAQLQATPYRLAARAPN
jgi:hypothetical protein